jgi:Uma2 family endonuclease
VACDRAQIEEYWLREPRVIVEVLSPTTETIDRCEKLLHYRRIEALEEYVLVAQKMPQVTVYRRGAGWAATVASDLDAAVTIRSVDLELPLERVYEGVFAKEDTPAAAH